jgi:peptidoglycan/xylan/chitin deacetylase (PgdA/CDA1 family)
MMRRFLKDTLCRGLASAGLDAWLGRVTRSIQWPWVVGYHLVVENDADATQVMPGLAISVRTLELHLDWIGRRFRFVSLAELGALAERGAARGKPLAAVTFDDGYRGVYDHAFPMLKRKGIPAAVFVVTDLVGTSRLHSHDSLYLLLRQRLGRPPGEAYQETRAMLQSLPRAEVDRLVRSQGRQRADTPSLLPLTWEMLFEMREAGFTIGSHTRTHPILTRLGPSEVLDEASGSRRKLERRLGAHVEHFAYPDGQFDPDVVGAVAEAGYRFAYTTCAHRDAAHSSLTLPRTMLWEQSALDCAGRFSSAILSCQAHGLLALASGCRKNHGARLVAQA